MPRDQFIDRSALRQPRVVDADLGQRRRRLETVAFHKDGVGHEAEQVLRIADAAMTQVLESLEHGP